MSNLNLISGSLKVLQKTLKPDFLPYSDELAAFYEKYRPVLARLTVPQHGYLRAICYKKDFTEITKFLNEQEYKYEQA